MNRRKGAPGSIDLSATASKGSLGRFSDVEDRRPSLGAHHRSTKRALSASPTLNPIIRIGLVIAPPLGNLFLKMDLIAPTFTNKTAISPTLTSDSCLLVSGSPPIPQYLAADIIGSCRRYHSTGRNSSLTSKACFQRYRPGHTFKFRS